MAASSAGSSSPSSSGTAGHGAPRARPGKRGKVVVVAVNERHASANSFEDPAQKMIKPENGKAIWRKVRSKGRMVKRPIAVKGYKCLVDPVTDKVVQRDENAVNNITMVFPGYGDLYTK